MLSKINISADECQRFCHLKQNVKQNFTCDCHITTYFFNRLTHFIVQHLSFLLKNVNVKRCPLGWAPFNTKQGLLKWVLYSK